MDQHRRHWLKMAGLLAVSSVFPKAWALEQPEVANGRLILLFLRGGFDGLFAFAPVADPRLAELRPTLAREVLDHGIPLGKTGFAAHPSCQLLADLFEQRQLSFAPCAGTNDTSRSHFQAQDLFELGTGKSAGKQGLLTRVLTAAGGKLRGIGFCNNSPLILQGAENFSEIMPLSGSGLKIGHGKILDAIRAMHAQQATGQALIQALDTQNELDAITGMDPSSIRGAPGINGFAKTADIAAQVLRNNPRLGIAFMDFGGFDTHANESGLLTRTLPLLGEGLHALRQGLGETEWQRTQVLIFTEFGRTVRENGTQGTDHGHGSLALLAGGAINGGKQIGQFAGLADHQLNEKRDLPVTVDWRNLIAEALRDTQGFSQAQLQRVFPK